MTRGRLLVLRSLRGSATAAILELGAMRVRCAIGRSGTSCRKREGDGATPLGRFGLLRVLYRADRVRRPASGLAVSRIRRGDGWCDAPDDRNYNRAVALPYPASTESMWREDRLYDIVVVLDHNQCPRVKGAGSAIFMHLASPGLTPTAGCIALSRPAMLRLLACIGPGTAIAVLGSAHRLAARPNRQTRAGRCR